tara:strand:+ start:1725 stop:2267 length:543 start_codon:yes stop_codon:yes gene_type:complete
MKELTKKLADVQTKLKAKKSSYNSFGKYYFRKAEDILEGVKPFLLQHNIYVTVSEELIATDPVPMIKTTATISDGADAIHATAVVGVDMQQKGMQTAQQFGAASTYAKKYALGNLFLIDDTEDADATNTHGKATQVAQKPKTKITKEQMTKAIKFVKDGGSVDAIKKKYELSAAQLKQLA